MMSKTHEFEFIAGNLCLDFANTWGGLPAESSSQERLISYEALLAWALQAQIMGETEAGLLLQRAAKAPEEATFVLESALGIREALREIFLALTRGEAPKEGDFALLNRALAQSMTGANLLRTAEGFRLEWLKDESALDQMIAPIVRSAASLLTSDELPYLRKCANPLCRWLFVDTSKNHRRQWCKTSGCGNVMRVRKHRERQKDKE